jgi:hypothetical protein
MSATQHKSTPSRPLSAHDVAGCSVAEVCWTEADGANRKILLSGSRRDVAVTVGLLSLSRFVDHKTVAVSPLEFLDDDAFAGELVRAAMAYLASRQGRVRAESAARVSDRAARKGS